MGPPTDPIASLRTALRGRYEIEREIGQGAYAVVYLAQDLKHERKVAVKVLLADPTSETGELRFIREIRLLARLQHPNILPLHDSGHVEALLYYVMPYVSGETLRQRIDRLRQLPADAACNIAREVADALAYAHGQGIIHRDIKPENILLSTGHPILADFGIARAIDLAGVQQLTRTGMGTPGTPAYMSPEQLLGDKEVDGRSDTYSLGCVLYEMLTGRPPFRGKEGFVKRFTDPPPRASTIRHDLPHWIDDVLEKALARSPRDRYQTARGFVEALCPPGSGTWVSAEGANSAADSAAPQSIVPQPVGTPPSGSLEFGADNARVDPLRAEELPHERHGLARRLAEGTRSRPKTAAVAAASLIALIALGATLGPEKVGAFLGEGAPLDSTRLVILPLTGETQQNRIIASRVADGLYDVLEGDWDGLRVVEATKVDELIRSKGGSPATQSDALGVARQLGAGKLLWGQVLAGSRIRATLYDVSAGTSEKEISLEGSPQNRSDFARVATELLRVPGRPAAADGGDGGTRSFPAWRAYGRGHVALGQWNLAGAEAEFGVAVAADPAYAAAQLWLAQTRALRSYYPVETWREQVARAVSIPRGLHQRDSILALALSSMAEGEYGNACGAYQQLVANDASDYIGWYGLGFCGVFDKALLPDPERRDGWGFRSSYLRAAESFDKATKLEPRLFTVLPFETLLRVAPIQSSQLRVGVTTGKSKGLFLAYPSFVAETLAHTPFPLAEVQGGRLRTAPKTAGLAAQQSRAFLLRLVLRWIREFPESPEAYEALAILQEASGELRVDRDGVSSALTATIKAQKLARSSDRRELLVEREVRLRLKRNEFERARLLSDSLLASAGTHRSQSAALAGLAALTGRINLTQRLLPPATMLVGSHDLNAPLPNDAVLSAATALFVNAALGVCSTNFDHLATRLDSLLQSYVPLPQQQGLREAWTEVSWSMAVPCRPALALRIMSPVDRLPRMQQAFARSEPAVIRAQFDSLGKLRENDRPGDVTPDALYQEAWLLAAIGDTSGAIRRLDLSLTALPTLGNLILEQIPQAAGLVRAMILRADLAHARGDATNGRKWARAAAILWANADAPLQVDVRRMRSIAQQPSSSGDPNLSSRR